MTGTIKATQSVREDAFTQFRTAWLRAIATAWVKNQEADLIANPKKYMGTWPDDWNRLDLVVHPEPHLLWVGDSWSWVIEKTPTGETREDSLLVYLPISTAIPEAERPIALAAYYAGRASIFSKGTPEPSHGRVPRTAGTTTLSTEHPIGAVFYPPPGPNPNGLFPSPTSFSDFSVALISALAQAWADENFAKRLVQDPKSTLARNFKMPWAMNIAIQDDPGPQWNSVEGNWDFTSEKNNELTLCLPAKPKGGGNKQTVALAAYNATGAEYPFTCCP